MKSVRSTEINGLTHALVISIVVLTTVAWATSSASGIRYLHNSLSADGRRLIVWDDLDPVSRFYILEPCSPTSRVTSIDLPFGDVIPPVWGYRWRDSRFLIEGLTGGHGVRPPNAYQPADGETWQIFCLSALDGLHWSRLTGSGAGQRTQAFRPVWISDSEFAYLSGSRTLALKVQDLNDLNSARTVDLSPTNICANGAVFLDSSNTSKRDTLIVMPSLDRQSVWEINLGGGRADRIADATSLFGTDVADKDGFQFYVTRVMVDGSLLIRTINASAQDFSFWIWTREGARPQFLGEYAIDATFRQLGRGIMVIYGKNDGSGRALWIRRNVGAESERLTAGFFDDSPLWVKNDLILFRRNKKSIWAMNTSGGDPYCLFRGETQSEESARMGTSPANAPSEGAAP